MKKKYLTVSELARLRNTTAETLRYYDRINLLKPEYVSEETGYRYYSIRQYEKLGTILELRFTENAIRADRRIFSQPEPEKVCGTFTGVSEKIRG